MAPTHDPLTEQDLSLLNNQSVEGSGTELGVDRQHDRLNYLASLGYFTIEQTHLSADPSQSRFRFTRTSKSAADEA